MNRVLAFQTLGPQGPLVEQARSTVSVEFCGGGGWSTISVRLCGGPANPI